MRLGRYLNLLFYSSPHPSSNVGVGYKPRCQFYSATAARPPFFFFFSFVPGINRETVLCTAGNWLRHVGRVSPCSESAPSTWHRHNANLIIRLFGATGAGCHCFSYGYTRCQAGAARRGARSRSYKGGMMRGEQETKKNAPFLMHGGRPARRKAE